MARRIKEREIDKGMSMKTPMTLSGWFSGRTTYLWLGFGDACLGTLGGYRLYRLAKAIVREYESDQRG